MLETVTRERWEPASIEEARDVSPLFAFLVKYAAAPDTWVSIEFDELLDRFDLDRPSIFGEFRKLHYGWFLRGWNLKTDDAPTVNDKRLYFSIPEEHYRLVIFEDVCRTAIPEDVREAIHEEYDHTCVYCGDPSEEIDHVLPVSRGGSDDPENLVASCASCNRRKSDRLLSELGWKGADNE